MNRPDSGILYFTGTKKRGRVRVFDRQAVKVSLFVRVFGGRAAKETTRYVGLYGVFFSGLMVTELETPPFDATAKSRCRCGYTAAVRRRGERAASENCGEQRKSGE